MPVPSSIFAPPKPFAGGISNVTLSGVAPAGALGGVGQWTPIGVQGPCVLQPLYGPALTPALSTQVAFIPTLFYTRDLSNVNPAVPFDNQPAVLHAMDGGVIFFPDAGPWYICNPNTAGRDIPYVLLPAKDDSALAWIEKRRGSRVTQSTFTPPNGPGLATVTHGWDALRTDLTFANAGGAKFFVAVGTAITEGAPVVADALPWESPCPWALHAIVSSGAGVASQARSLEIRL